MECILAILVLCRQSAFLLNFSPVLLSLLLLFFIFRTVGIFFIAKRLRYMFFFSFVLFMIDIVFFFLSFEAAFRLKCNVIVSFHSIPMFPSLKQKCCSIIQYYKNFYQHMLTVLLLKTKTWLFFSFSFFLFVFLGRKKAFSSFLSELISCEKANIHERI